ncbi:MAG: DUF2075 domain-containing protein [Bacilli bacterium]|nr:DUF2075 domain-containing protein [Bacilli bacterium]
MKPQYLLSVCQAHRAHYDGKLKLDKNHLLLKRNEVKTLDKLCDLISQEYTDYYELLNGYFVGYSIPQIANEFDLLRFGTDYIINIEMKGPLTEDKKLTTISAQMRKQHYYLKFLGKELKVITFVEDDGFYLYKQESDEVISVDINAVIEFIQKQTLDENVDLEKIFKPSNYLVSPFNKVERFIAGEYFLTTDQAKKKREIIESIDKNEFIFFCISADAGTGKTLLTYDIAKTYKALGKSTLVFHCATLNSGQFDLINKYQWDIRSIKSLRGKEAIDVVGFPDLIVVDEAQRIWKSQLDRLIRHALEWKIKVIFSYDPKQYLRENETLDIHSYLNEEYSTSTAPLKGLTKRIRTNKKLASFVNNMMIIGSSKDNLDYTDITIEYFSNTQSAEEYIQFLDNSAGWKAITFTPSQYEKEPVDSLSRLCDEKAHGVIGQEFEKVVFAMDSNFKYNERNRLSAKVNYYSLRGMWYQIVTRAVNELKIIVIDNPELYEKLLQIKSMGNTSGS